MENSNKIKSLQEINKPAIVVTCFFIIFFELTLTNYFWLIFVYK